MKRALLAWEMGSSLGHLDKLAELTHRLNREGITVAVAVTDLSRMASHFSSNVPLFQAPVWPMKAVGLPRLSASYTEILVRQGYLSPTGLEGLLRAWRSLMTAFKPDLLVAESGPTALLAARLVELPSVALGNGFSVPPRVSPFPPLFPLSPKREQRLHLLENRVLSVVNDTLRKLGGSQLPTLSDLMDVRETMLCTFRELDHYRREDDVTYYGPLFGLRSAARIPFSEKHEHRIFAYLKPDYPGLSDLLLNLAKQPLNVVAYLADVSGAFVKKHSTSSLRISPKPLDIDVVAHGCDLAVTHGGHNLTASFLLKGIPMMLIPRNLEQLITAQNVSRLGAGIRVPDDATPDWIVSAIIAAVRSEKLKTAALSFSRARAGYRVDETFTRVHERLRELLSG